MWLWVELIGRLRGIAYGWDDWVVHTHSSIFIPICTLSVVSAEYYHMASGWREAKLAVGSTEQQKLILVDLSIMAENLFYCYPLGFKK